MLRYVDPMNGARDGMRACMQEFEKDNKHLWPKPHSSACTHGAWLPCLGCERTVCAEASFKALSTTGMPDMWCGLCVPSASTTKECADLTLAFFMDQAANYEDIVDVIRTLPMPIWEEVLPELEVWRTNTKWIESKNLTRRDCDTITGWTHPRFFPPSDPSYAEVEACPTFVASVATVTTFTPTVGAETGAPTATGTTRQTLTLPKCTKPYSSH